MNLKSKLIIESHDNANVYIVTEDNDIPSVEVTECPKKKAIELLNSITGYNISTTENDWISLELIDVNYDENTKTVYIIYVCRVPEMNYLNVPYVWTNIAEIRPKIERLRGLF